MVQVTCAHCGKKISKAPRYVKKNKNNFCNRDHYYLWMKDNNEIISKMRKGKYFTRGHRVKK